MFWLAVFAISMFWHRGTSSTSPAGDSAADQYRYGVDLYPTSLPVYGYPAFDSAALYKYFYNLYMKRLTSDSSSDAAAQAHPRHANPSVSKQEPRKRELRQISDDSSAPSEPETPLAAPPVPAASAPTAERADIGNARFAPSRTVPVTPAKAVELQKRNLPQWALPARASSTASATPALRVAPVGLPGYEPEPTAIPKGIVRSAYPKIEVVIQPEAANK